MSINHEPKARERTTPPEESGRTRQEVTDRHHPVLLVLLGGLCIAGSAVFVKLSGTSAGTAAFFRCTLALVVLVPLALVEYRRIGARPRRLWKLDAAAGVLLGVDYVLWAASIATVGASIATVLINIQVVVFPLLGRIFSKTPLARRFLVTLPLMLFGVALASGSLGVPVAGSDPVLGGIYGAAAGCAYAGYLYLMRLGGGQGHFVQPVGTATATAALAALVLGGLWTGIDLPSGWAAWGWLTALALIGQVLAWLIMTPALPRLAPHVSAALLLLHPVMAILLGMAIGERPTALQLGGCVLVLLVVWVANRTPQERRRGGKGEQRKS
ncbi:DMT family transporter [Streptomyces sp. NBC_00237]|uniref:DMT family transporter n=1 Tax=Streptomyces sp. NBC_00237 TaxID=2975687 RepID=UPI002250EC0A|nr:DMT family transporter [Streptomyces sp. NBC_00237]MCX5205987.1 DMT family transporter [Streptomyces sp. NBC_00237]